MKLNNVRFECKSPEHSEAIQKRLFELGIKWSSGSTEIRYTESFSLGLFVDGGKMFRDFPKECNLLTLEDLYDPEIIKNGSSESEQCLKDLCRYFADELIQKREELIAAFVKVMEK